MNKEELLNWLRKESKSCEETALFLSKEAGQNFDAEKFELAIQINGQAQAYRFVIKHLKGLSEREYQIQRKKGTL